MFYTLVEYVYTYSYIMNQYEKFKQIEIIVFRSGYTLVVRPTFVFIAYN